MEPIMEQITIVISLQSSHDRRAYIQKSLEKMNHRFEFLDATTPLDLARDKQNSAIAIWDSHIRAMKRFLASDAINCLIFEDDVDLQEKISFKVIVLNNLSQIMLSLPEGYSIVQFGNMGFGKRNILAVVLRNLYYIFKRRYRFDELAYNKLQGNIGTKRCRQLEVELSKLTGVNTKPLEGFVTGAQAYLLSRSAAQYLISDYESRSNWDLSSRDCLDTFLERQSNAVNTPVEIRTIRLAKQIFQQRSIGSMNNFYPGN
jgi:GR25 family glycosyltransferase involved in LPS biosynthesis